MANIRSDIQNYGEASSVSKLDTSARLKAEEQKLIANTRKSLAGLGWDTEEIEKAIEKVSKKFKQQHKKDLQEEEKALLEISNKFGDKLKLAGKQLGEDLGKAVKAAASKFASGVDNYIGVYADHMASIATRLQGFGKSYEQITSTISTNLAGSPYVKQTQVLENLSKFVDSGITQNIEQRAFLASVSDRIAKTFNAFDSSLISIIKLQQEDSTVARLGLESSLNKFLNQAFGDTSYLGQLSTAVRASLLQAESQLGVAQSAQVQYDIEKWLGGLSALGLSSQAISSLGQGLGYLGSGNITALTSNTQLQNLLLMSAQKGGVDYASLLTGGLTSSSINNLFSGLVAIGQQMNQESNLVLKNQLANLLGLSVSDLTAIGNLTSSQYSDLLKSNLSYGGMVDETVLGLSTIGQRTSMKDKINNIFQNLMATTGEQIANSALAYGTYLTADLLQGLGDIKNIGTKTKGIVIGLSSIFSVIKGVGSLFSGGGLDLGAWGKGLDAESIKRRGGEVNNGNLLSTSLTISTKGSTESTSETAGFNVKEVEEIQQEAASSDNVINDIKILLNDKVVTQLDAIYNLLDLRGIVIRNLPSSNYGMINSTDSGLGNS